MGILWFLDFFWDFFRTLLYFFGFFLDFLIFGFYGFFSKLLRLLIKVTKGTLLDTKIGPKQQNKLFFANRTFYVSSLMPLAEVGL